VCNSIKTAIILAAGKGSRLNEKNDPFFSKAMYKVFDLPLICYGIDALVYSGIEKIFIMKNNYDYGIETIKNRYADTVSISFIENNNYTSLISLMKFEEIVTTPFVLLDSDIYIQKDNMERFLKHTQNDSMIDGDVFCYIPIVENAHSKKVKNVNVDENTNKVIGFDKGGYLNGYYGAMIYVFYRNPFNFCLELKNRGEQRFTIFFSKLVDRYKVKAVLINNLWDCNDIEDIHILKRTYFDTNLDPQSEGPEDDEIVEWKNKNPAAK